MKSLLLGLLITWSPPTMNCNGLPLADLDHYLVRWRHVQVDTTRVCGDPETTGVVVPCYIGEPGWSDEVVVQGSQASVRSTLPFAPPAVNEVYIFEVEAFDKGGNADGCEEP